MVWGYTFIVLWEMRGLGGKLGLRISSIEYQHVASLSTWGFCLPRAAPVYTVWKIYSYNITRLVPAFGKEPADVKDLIFI